MSQVYNPEAGLIQEIERLALEARDVHRRIDQAGSAADQQVLKQQLHEIEESIRTLQTRLPH
jgi:hypothetical protein